MAGCQGIIFDLDITDLSRLGSRLVSGAGRGAKLFRRGILQVAPIGLGRGRLDRVKHAKFI